MSFAPATPAILIVTGAAATGQSTIGHRLRAQSGLVVIDGDVLGSGAAAMAHGRRDYVEFWRFAVSLCREIHSNGLVPVVPCICLPDQVLAAIDDEVVHFLGLLSQPSTVRRRIAERNGASEVPSPETHVQFDRTLRAVRVPAPHTFEPHDVSTSEVGDTIDVAIAWAARHTGHRGS